MLIIDTGPVLTHFSETRPVRTKFEDPFGLEKNYSIYTTHLAKSMRLNTIKNNTFSVIICQTTLSYGKSIKSDVQLFHVGFLVIGEAYEISVQLLRDSNNLQRVQARQY